MGNYFQTQPEEPSEHDRRLFEAGIAYGLANARTNVVSTNTNQHVEDLKNALLSFALIVNKEKDPNLRLSLNMNYTGMDGTELPEFSGCDVQNACFTYLTSNVIMEEKVKAIQRYLDKNLGCEEQIVEFFDRFVEKIGDKNNK
jgi:hypothetical protein